MRRGPADDGDIDDGTESALSEKEEWEIGNTIAMQCFTTESVPIILLRLRQLYNKPELLKTCRDNEQLAIAIGTAIVSICSSADNVSRHPMQGHQI